MDVNGKRYIRSDSANCAQIVEDSSATLAAKMCLPTPDPHEKLKAMLNSPDNDSDDLSSLPSIEPPKFGTVIHNRIFVGGFSITTTDEELWKFFSGFATVTAARIIYDRAGVSKCYGFVTFASPRHARLIVKQSGGVMFSPLGRLRVAQAVRKQTTLMSHLMGDCVPPATGPICYQLVCAGPPPPSTAAAYAPTYPHCDLSSMPYAVYSYPYDGATVYAASPAALTGGQYALMPAAAPCPCDATCCQPLEMPPRAPSVPPHTSYIY